MSPMMVGRLWKRRAGCWACPQWPEPWAPGRQRLASRAAARSLCSNASAN